MAGTNVLEGLRRGNDGGMSDRLIAEQIAYYRQRTPEYDETAYDLSGANRERIESIVAELPSAEPALEIACGTGIWTAQLARRIHDLTAVDTSLESLELARERCPAHVRFVCTDVLRWLPNRRYSLVFFAAWLSHVPDDRFEAFFAALRSRLAPRGRVVFVDEHVSLQSKERLTEDSGVVLRRLSNGSEHRIVKIFVDPPRLASRLRDLGWIADMKVDAGGWVIGRAQPEGEL
jgi:SAM-dependent methyltransferase